MLATAPAAAVLALLLANVPSAAAATASVVGSTLTFVAAPGESNSVGIAYDAAIGGYKITDSTAPVTGGRGCGAIDHEIDCEDTGIQIIVINLRDGDDRWFGGDIKVVPSVDGGAGNDDLGGIGFLNGGDGDDTVKALDSGGVLDGGAGNDTLVGGEGDDVIDGGAGDDLLIGNAGVDVLTGGSGLDRIDASSGGAKTIDCQGRDDEVVYAGSAVKRQNCSPAPQVKIAATRTTPARLLAGRLAFSVSCDRPCAVHWELRLTGSAKKLIHHAGGWIDRRLVPVDSDGFRDPLDGPQRFTAGVIGSATKKGLRRLKSFRATLYIQAFGRDGLSTTQTRALTIA
jgi:hypothetical protein